MAPGNLFQTEASRVGLSPQGLSALLDAAGSRAPHVSEPHAAPAHGSAAARLRERLHQAFVDPEAAAEALERPGAVGATATPSVAPDMTQQSVQMMAQQAEILSRVARRDDLASEDASTNASFSALRGSAARQGYTALVRDRPADFLTAFRRNLATET